MEHILNVPTHRDRKMAKLDQNLREVVRHVRPGEHAVVEALSVILARCIHEGTDFGGVRILGHGEVSEVPLGLVHVLGFDRYERPGIEVVVDDSAVLGAHVVSLELASQEPVEAFYREVGLALPPKHGHAVLAVDPRDRLAHLSEKPLVVFGVVGFSNCPGLLFLPGSLEQTREHLVLAEKHLIPLLAS